MMAMCVAAIPTPTQSSDNNLTQSSAETEIADSEIAETVDPKHSATNNLDSTSTDVQSRILRIKKSPDFEQAVLQPGFTVAYVYKTPSCKPCYWRFWNMQEALAAHPRLKVIAINYNDLENINGSHDVQNTPAFFFYKDGRLVDRFTGMRQKEIEALLNKYDT